MSEIIIVAHSDANEAAALATQLATISERFVILEADSTEKIELLCNEYGCSLLYMDYRLSPENPGSLTLPGDTILLLQAEEEQAEQLAVQLTGSSRICDIIPPCSSTALLRQKMFLLLAQRRLKKEFIQLQDKHKEMSKKLNRTEQTLLSQQQYLDILTVRDGLTGLYNRKHLTTVLKKEFQRARRYKTDLTLLLLDIDSLKTINHTAGHLFGDFVLNELAARLTGNTRDSDLCFRFGGGDFIVLLPQTTLKNSCHAAEKLRNCCAEKAFHNAGESRRVTLSIGIASALESCPETPEEFIKMADTALFQAKGEGKNRFKTFSTEFLPKEV